MSSETEDTGAQSVEHRTQNTETTETREAKKTLVAVKTIEPSVPWKVPIEIHTQSIR